MRILIVEDEMLVALQIELFLADAGYDVVGIADCIAAALSLATAHRPDLALVDINLAGGDNGIELAAQLRAQGIAVLLVTGNCPAGLSNEVAFGCLGKPFGQHEILAAIAVADAAIRGAPVTAVPPSLRLF